MSNKLVHSAGVGLVYESPTEIDKRQATDIASIILFSIMNLPVRELSIIRSYNRVAVCSFILHGYQDPIAPIVLAPMGEAWLIWYERYITHLHKFGRYHRDLRGWSMEAKSILTQLLKSIGNELSEGERQFLVFELMKSIARPE